MSKIKKYFNFINNLSFSNKRSRKFKRYTKFRCKKNKKFFIDFTKFLKKRTNIIVKFDYSSLNRFI